MKPTLVALCCAVCLVSGCSSSSGLQEVSGTVKFKSQLLEYGEIQFLPEDTKTGNLGQAPITNGVYKIAAEKGLKPGKYRVLITSPDRKTASGGEEAPGVAPPPPKERIPARFNSDSKEFVEVTTSGPNQFDFNIP